MKTRNPGAAAIVAAAALMCGTGPAWAGAIKGKISFAGEAPQRRQIQMAADPKCQAANPDGRLGDTWLVANGALQNVFVYVKEGLTGKTFPVPTEPVEIDQVGCMYTPRVAGIMVGQELVVKNGDDTLHNVHAVPENSKPFNNAMPLKDMSIKKKFTAPEIMVRFKCDVHNWMTCYFGVVPHPYFSVTGTEGTFVLDRLPAGEYLVEAWHEKFGTRTQQVSLAENQSTEINFSFGSDL